MLAGNPNVGKSVLFGRLTGRYAEVSNYPGTTVDVAKGHWHGHQVADSPGVYSLAGDNDEQRLARRILGAADIVVNVVDGTRLHRDLFLTLQLLDRGLPLMVAVNMMDEVRQQGLCPDLNGLSRALGVPVLPVTAVSGEGMEGLEQALARLCSALPQPTGSKGEGNYRLRANEFSLRYGGGEGRLFGADLWLTRPFPGLVVAAAVLVSVYWLIGGLVAGSLVDLTEGIIMGRWVIPALSKLLAMLLPATGLLREIIVGQYGVVPLAVGYGLGLLLPLVFSFYLLLAVLEDSGYLPRLAVLLDNVFTPLGLNGKGVIPLILGFGCVTMAVISTRMLGTRRERLIITALLALAVPCSAQVGVIAMLLVPMGLKWLALYSLIILLVFLATGMLLNRLLPGKSGGLFLELPPLRLPRPVNLWRKAAGKSKAFLKDAIPLFALGAALVTALDYFGGLIWLQQLLAPLSRGWLKLPPETVGAFVMGIIRRDLGTAGLYALGLEQGQLFVALVVMTLFVPCLATMLVVVKEQGVKMGVAVWLLSLAAAVLVGGLVAMAII